MWEAYRQFAQTHFPQLCQKRPVNSHKGTFGTVAIIGGNTGMSGAVILAARAALKLGAGKVKIGFAQDSLPLPVLESQPEIMLYTATDLLEHTDIDAWAIGCGLGGNEHALSIMQTSKSVLATQAVIWDADALNLISQHPNLQDALQTHHIITPHPAEAARLLNITTASIQDNRLSSVQQLQQKLGCVCVLKGHQSLVQSAQSCYRNDSGNPGLASAGSGDVLSGIIASLLAQGFEATDAACAGVWLHGAASEVLALQNIGPIGMVASELMDAARLLRNHLTA